MKGFAVSRKASGDMLSIGKTSGNTSKIIPGADLRGLTNFKPYSDVNIVTNQPALEIELDDLGRFGHEVRLPWELRVATGGFLGSRHCI